MAVVLSVGDWKLNLPPEVRGVIHGQWTRLKIDAFTHLFIVAKCIFTDYCLFLIQTPPPSLFLDLYNILCFDASHIRKLILPNGFKTDNNLNNACVLKNKSCMLKNAFFLEKSVKGSHWRSIVVPCNSNHTQDLLKFSTTPHLIRFPQNDFRFLRVSHVSKPRSKLLINVLLWLIYANRLSNEKIIADDAIEFGERGIERQSVDN